MLRVADIPPGVGDGKQGLDDYLGAGGNLEELLEGATPYTGFEPADPEWPVLAEDALQGVAGECVRSIGPHTEADPVAVLSNIIVGFGNIIHQGAYVLMGPKPQYLKEYVVLVGRSSKARKGTSWEYPEALFREVDEDWANRRVISGLSSGEGLIYAVRDPVERYDANAGEMKVVDRGEPDKRLMVVEGEYARVLKVMGRDGNSLSAILRDAYDRDRLQASRTRPRTTRTGPPAPTSA
jgi:hypothetical protein